MISNNKNLYNFKILEKGQSQLYNNGLKEMQSGVFDGLIIKNVLNEADCARIIDFVEKNYAPHFFEDPLVKLFPLGFAAIAQIKEEEIIEERLKFNTKMLLHQNQFFGVEIIKNIISALKPLASGLNVSVASVLNGHAAPTQYRRLKQSTEGFPIHCGNAFEKLSPSFYAHLRKTVETTDQLSYYIVLQNTEKGGELTLYNQKWSEEQSMRNQHEFNLDNVQVFNSLEISTQNKMSLRPEVGDMLVYEGGNIWHKVEPILGNGDRITLGGFIGFNTHQNEVYIWS